MKTYQIIIAFLLLIPKASFAQNARFTNQGIIEYEKKVNIYALIKDQIKKNPDQSYYVQAFEDYQKEKPAI